VLAFQVSRNQNRLVGIGLQHFFSLLVPFKYRTYGLHVSNEIHQVGQALLKSWGEISGIEGNEAMSKVRPLGKISILSDIWSVRRIGKYPTEDFYEKSQSKSFVIRIGFVTTQRTQSTGFWVGPFFRYRQLLSTQNFNLNSKTIKVNRSKQLSRTFPTATAAVAISNT
jgi:hypothetical protein